WSVSGSVTPLGEDSATCTEPTFTDVRPNSLVSRTLTRWPPASRRTTWRTVWPAYTRMSPGAMTAVGGKGGEYHACTHCSPAADFCAAADSVGAITMAATRTT